MFPSAENNGNWRRSLPFCKYHKEYMEICSPLCVDGFRLEVVTEQSEMLVQAVKSKTYSWSAFLSYLLLFCLTFR